MNLYIVRRGFEEIKPGEYRAAVVAAYNEQDAIACSPLSQYGNLRVEHIGIFNRQLRGILLTDYIEA